MYYYPYADKLRVRKSWGREETWDIYATPLNQQKPDRIRKNKPERRRDSLERRETKNADEGHIEITEDDAFAIRYQYCDDEPKTEFAVRLIPS